MKKFYVYIHTCPNGKKYVGCTTQAKPKYRWGKNGEGYQYNDHFYRAILKYGWNNFQHEVFEVDSAEEMYRKEIELIGFYHSNDPEYGYNNSVGGEKGALGCKHSEEIRKKKSEAGKRVQKKAHSDPEYKKRISEIMKKVHSDPEYRKRMSEIMKGKPHKPFSEEHKKHLSEAHKGKPKPRVKIKLPDGTIIEITKNNLARDYVNKGKKFEHLSY